MGEREALEAVGLNIRTREQWGAIHDYTTSRSVESPGSQLFLHITVTSAQTRPNPDQHAQYVERIGISRFGIGISYNALCMPGGLLYEGQPLTRRGAHTVNDFGRTPCPTHGGSLLTKAGGTNLNWSVRAIAKAGMVTDPFTDADVVACALWGAALIKAGYMVPTATWHGHRCVSSKSCPGNLGFARIPEIEEQMAIFLKPDPGDDDMDRIKYDESLIRHAHAMGWMKKPDGTPDLTPGTLTYWLQSVASGNANSPNHPDYGNIRDAVTNGIARSSGIAGPHSHTATTTIK